VFAIDDTLIHPAGHAVAQDLGLEEAQRLLARSKASRVPVPGAVYGTLLNDPAALAALGEAVNAPPYKGAPRAPVLYLKPRNTRIGHGDPVPVPEGVPALATGPALGLVIGRTACRVDEAQALDFVAGCVVVNDLSVPHESFYRPSVRLRARDGFCPMGPWVRALRHVGDPDALHLRVWVDDELCFSAGTHGRVRGAARLLADVTAFMTLQPGDVLLTGVPHGAPTARAGQRVAVEIEGVGRLENPLVAEEELFAGARA
jgi:5-oxopent-3-ene-1,2,5-tricarboxylate decarboxylase/2-hydroxyhepta-2,4-diene-1,7-dioate isomerase